MQQAEKNENECKKQQAAKEWLNQFAESAKKQNEQREAKKKQSLPSTFHWSPEIAKMYKKQDQWKDIQAMANQEFAACIQPAKKGDMPTPPPVVEQNDASVAAFENGPCLFGDLPEKVCSLASYCRRRKQQGLPLKGLWHASAYVRQLDFSPADSFSRLAFGEEILLHLPWDTRESHNISIQELFGPFGKF